MSYVDDVIRCWLGYARALPEDEMRQSGWSPDSPDAYCPRCGETIGAGELTECGCGSCRGRPAFAEGVVRLGAYASPLRDWVLSVKYERWCEMGLLLGRRLGRSLRDARGSELEGSMVVPMPMPWLRRWHRGIDHTVVLAAGVAAELQLPMRRVLWHLAGRPQITRRADERRRHGGRGLTQSPFYRFRPTRRRRAILVDDVRTTGSSLRAAVSTLHLAAPAGIIVAVAAVADPPGRETSLRTSAT
jgi:predicted amidophosphoribosyltransferase